MQTKKKTQGSDEAHEIEMGLIKLADCLENFDDRLLRDLVDLAFAKAGEEFDKQSNLRPLADQPKRVIEEIFDVQVQLRRSGIYDDAGRPIIDFSYSLKFHEFDILREL